MIKCTIPEGQCGEWKIEKFSVSEEDARMFNLHNMFSFSFRPQLKAGDYTRLKRDGVVVMSDTTAEMSDLYYFGLRVKGDVLISGLGLGMALKIALNKPEVKSVEVVEISEDVINLVGKHFKDERLVIYHANILDWKPPKGKKYDTIWHDIWDEICADNLEDMKKLSRRFGHYLNKGGYQACWARSYIK